MSSALCGQAEGSDGSVIMLSRRMAADGEENRGLGQRCSVKKEKDPRVSQIKRRLMEIVVNQGRGGATACDNCPQ